MCGRWRTVSLLLRRIAAASKSTTHHLSCPPESRFLPRPPFNLTRRFLSFGASSAIPYRVPVDSDDFDSSGPPNLDHNYELGAQEDGESVKVPVKAYFLSTSINLKDIQAENLGNIIPPSSRSSNSIALRFRNFNSDTNGAGTHNKTSSYRYMVVYQYGSAVLFNIEDHEVDNYLELVKRHASGLLLEMRKDDYAVKEMPRLVEDMRGGPDYIVLKSLDTDGIRIIGSVLGQSIALDYFVSQVDSLVEEFADINRGMEKTGTFTMDKKKLLQLVGKANSNLADVILKVGLFERSEIAWRDAKYAAIYEYLREEYEVAQRFGNLDFKLKFVEHNIHFLQEVLQNRKSDFLEWCIIFLLFIENVISIYEILRDSSTIS
ncbi:protein RETARDED ROOT GROWTH, mitochondrial [Prosopis cineraria]|uniref:protein RETARDED ROOT GROWTH, mitochondrial n=1 Tax=Prosopis cineraria TaxID=364024 RepID=UPI00240FB518|nr:protein RETARDED ROOT GROWTH, mitochondrial [Prosopis cineraria]